MDSPPSTISSASLLGEDRLSLIRKRNRRLIIIFFSLIFSTAVITGGFIIHLIRIHNSQSQQSLRQNLAIQHFCSATQYEYSCLASLSNLIRTTQSANPNQIFLLSLEKSVIEMSHIIAARPSTCSGSLSHALSQLNSSSGVIRVNPDLEMLTREIMSAVKEAIKTAIEDLESCVNNTRKDNSTAKDEVSGMVYDILKRIKYADDFLLHCNMINENFRVRPIYGDGKSWRSGIVETFLEVSLFGSQYFVLVILCCLFLRLMAKKNATGSEVS